MANPKDPAKPVARSPGFWENLMSPKPKGPATSLRNATHLTQQVVPTAAAAADAAALNASTSARHGGRAQLPDYVYPPPPTYTTAPLAGHAVREMPRRYFVQTPPSYLGPAAVGLSY